jgi:hypothetical protein
MPNPIERFANVAKVYSNFLSVVMCLTEIIYINDIVADINSSIKVFADDTSLYMIVDDPMDAAETLNTDLAKIHDWSMKWLVTFNPDKTESMIVSRKSNRPQPLLVHFLIYS